jgi:quercetin dioxygenase-like cupin family protein
MTHLVQHTAAGEGLELTAPNAVLTIKIDAGHTDDQYELFEVDAPRGPATPLHRTGWAKAYYVLNGRMIVQVEDEAFDLGPVRRSPSRRVPCTLSRCSARRPSS